MCGKDRADRLRNDWRLRYMTEKDGWIMVRHPGCIPFAMMVKEWLDLPLASAERGHDARSGPRQRRQNAGM